MCVNQADNGNIREKTPGDDMPMIRLRDRVPLGQGMERECYLHPDDPSQVIKIARNNIQKGGRANEDELRGYRLLLRDGVDLSRLSRCHGYVETDLGPGLVCDAIRNHDGEIADTVWNMVVNQEDCDLRPILDEVDRLCTHLLENCIWIFDINLKNIALSKREDGSLCGYVIDLKGRAVTNEFLPFSRMLKVLSRMKLQRRCRQLLERIPDFHRRRLELRHLKKEGG